MIEDKMREIEIDNDNETNKIRKEIKLWFEY